MMANTHRWLFVGHVPILCKTRRLTKQFQIWFWLDSKPIMKEIRVELLMPEKNPEEERRKIRGYVS